jgi:hypothetical protein
MSGIRMRPSSSGTIIGCHFEGNSGPGVLAVNAKVHVEDCRLISNGSGIVLLDGQMVLETCKRIEGIKQIDSEQKAALIEALRELSSEHDSQELTVSYDRLIALAANHATVLTAIAPVLQALAGTLS